MADWKDVAAKVAEILPAAGATFAGPLGGGIGLAIKALANAFGITSAEPKPDQVMTAIAADPQALLKLQLAMVDFQKAEMEEETKRLKMELEDVQSARQRQIEVEKATGKRDVNLYVLAWTIIGGFLGLTGLLLYYSYLGKQIADQTGVLYMLLGTLSTSFGMVVGYFFGSSRGSAEKSIAIERSAAALAAKVKA